MDWIAAAKNIVIKEGKKEITLTVGSKEVSVNSDTIVIDCAPKMLSPGRSFVPLRFITETLAAKVTYDPTTRQITITQ